jgi:Domain of unknown function (DUF4145)
MHFKLTTPQAYKVNWVLKIRCPICRQRGTFDDVHVPDVASPPSLVAGMRRCPDQSCQALIFFAGDTRSKEVLITYPAQRIDFDPTNVPAAVLKALEEAITCHANKCFIACAIMVRKTLEELCRERGATGANLKEKLKALGSKVILPPELLNGVDDLRLLGNDAAHIESQEFNEVGQEEVEVGLELAKEVLKAVYQYSVLLNRLRALKKP